MKNFKQKSICLIVAIIFFPFQIIAQCEYEIGLIEFFSQQAQSYAQEINVLESDLVDAEYALEDAEHWRNHYEVPYIIQLYNN